MEQDQLTRFLVKYNPAVSKHWHIALAGITWAGVGVLLCRYSYGWLSAVPHERAIVFAVIGLAIALVVYRFGMSRIARKNLNRLKGIQNKKCLFGFLTWKSYANIALMVTVGITLRHSAVAKDYLSLVYTSMGGSLLIGSVQYYRGLLDTIS